MSQTRASENLSVVVSRDDRRRQAPQAPKLDEGPVVGHSE